MTVCAVPHHCWASCCPTSDSYGTAQTLLFVLVAVPLPIVVRGVVRGLTFVLLPRGDGVENVRKEKGVDGVDGVAGVCGAASLGDWGTVAGGSSSLPCCSVVKEEGGVSKFHREMD